MSSKITNIEIPMDIYDSTDELVVIVPIWWVHKQSLEVYLEKTALVINWERICPAIKDTLRPLQQECFWWSFSKKLDLPQNVYFDKIHTKLTIDNILIIVVPKIIIPDKIKLEVEYN